jgi:hypothetical protein
MQLCLVVNFFTQPFRKRGNDADPEMDAERVNKHGKRLLMVCNAGNSNGARMNGLYNMRVRSHFPLILTQQNNAQVATALSPLLLSRIDSVKIILNGHGEPNVPFIFDDSDQTVDTWKLMKSLMQLITRPEKEDGLGLRNLKSMRISVPICYAVSGKFEPGNESVCYELARYFTHERVYAKVREITTGAVTIVGAENVVYGIAPKGFPERSDNFQHAFNRQMAARCDSGPEKMVIYYCALNKLPYTGPVSPDMDLEALRRGGTYTRGSWHGDQRFSANQEMVKERERIKDRLKPKFENDLYFGKGEGHKAVITVSYPVRGEYQLEMNHKYEHTALINPRRDALVKEGSRFDPYDPMIEEPFVEQVDGLAFDEDDSLCMFNMPQSDKN